MLHKLALGIMAQPGVYKHTYKITLSEHPSKMMSGGPSMRISGRLSVMKSGSPSMRMFGHLSVMMSGGPSMRMFGRLSMMMSESPSMMMFGWLSVMMSGGPSMRMFGLLSMMMSESPSMMMFGWLSVMMSGGPSMRMFGLLSMMSGSPPLRISEQSSEKICEQSSKKISERSSDKHSGQSSENIFERPSEKISGHKNEEFQEQKPDGEGYTGLENQGATCYLNTVLQILFMTEAFREAVLEKHQHHNSNINNHIAQLFKHLKSGERNPATTEGITAELKINVHKQEDAAKCLQKILNMVDREISKIFQGTKVDTTICRTPAKHHDPLKQVKTFFIISISLESQDHINVQSCFDSYFAPIVMSGEDQQIYCKDCEMMMDTEIRCSLQKVPSVLVLHLERFELDYDTMCCVKNESLVEIPAQLSVKDEAGVNHMYDLYAIANHVGSLSGGHYYAHIRSFEDQQWYQFNDSSVQKMCLKSDLDKPLFSDEAYLLLYKKSAAVSVASHSQTAEDNQNTMEERRSSKCENPENDETVTDNIKVPVELKINSNLAEQQAESTNTSACDGCLDVPESTRVTVEHQHPSSLSEDTDYKPKTNAMVSDEESKSLMGTNYVSNTSEIVNKMQKKRNINVYETRSSFWTFVFSLAIFICIYFFYYYF